MRRMLAVLVTVMVLWTACDNTSDAVVTAFGADAEIVFRDQTLCGRVICRSKEGTLLTLSQPHFAEDVTLRWDGHALYTQLGDDVFIQNAALPLAVPRLLHEVYTAVSVDNGALDGVINNYRYRCEYDDQTGLPIGVTFQDIPLTVRFSQAVVWGES